MSIVGGQIKDENCLVEVLSTLSCRGKNTDENCLVEGQDETCIA